MLYFAYGSNLDYTRMFSRCKSAKVYGYAELEGYKLVFMENNSGRIVANLVESEGAITPGMIYDIVDSDIEVLDKYEGYPYVYGRETIKVGYKGSEIECVTYVMAEEYYFRTKYATNKVVRGYGVPKRDYFNFILNGYVMFNLPQKKLLEAYEYSREKGDK